MEQKIKMAKDVQMASIDVSFKREMRRIALNSAERLQPTMITSSPQVGLNPTKEKSAKSLLLDAEIIYDWLVKEV